VWKNDKLQELIVKGRKKIYSFKSVYFVYYKWQSILLSHLLWK